MNRPRRPFLRQPARLGGARADFVASLGRKANDARAVLSTALAEAGTANEKSSRDELRRGRIHALAVSARMLRFDAMTQAPRGRREGRLERAAEVGEATDEDLATVASVLDDLPALAWGDGPRQHATQMPPVQAPSTGPGSSRQDGTGAASATRQKERSAGGWAAPAWSALLVGSEMLAEALTDEDVLPGALSVRVRADRRRAGGDRPCPHGRSRGRGHRRRRGRRRGASWKRFLDDPLTEPVPIVIVGGFREGAAAARGTSRSEVAKTAHEGRSPRRRSGARATRRSSTATK